MHYGDRCSLLTGRMQQFALMGGASPLPLCSIFPTSVDMGWVFDFVKLGGVPHVN